MCGFPAFVSLFRHGHPFFSHEASTNDRFPLHTILGLFGSESKVHLFQEILPTRVKAHLARFPVLLLNAFATPK